MSNNRNIPANLQEAVDDIEARFLLVLDENEIQSSDRLFFQLEQAWWFYEDFLADTYSHLPHFRKFQTFSQKMFETSKLLLPIKHKYQEMWNEFFAYKQQIPSYGAVMINEKLDKVVLVRAYNGKSWGFPKGKINEGEDPLDCACREVYEETSFDIKKHMEEYALNDEEVVTEKGKLEYFSNNGKMTKLFLVQKVPESFDMKPNVRKEISEIKWFHVNQLPRSFQDKDTNGRFWQVNYVSGQLRRWIKAQKLAQAKNKSAQKIKTKDRDKGKFSVTAKAQQVTLLTREKITPSYSDEIAVLEEPSESFLNLGMILDVMRPILFEPVF